MDDVLAKTLKLVVAIFGDRDDGTAPGVHLLDVGFYLVVSGVRLRCDDDDGHELVDERDGTVLHLGR
eukprot:CAMPEP_0194772980 /NCGR_PEP_ID=MMETSP0323_2-20130528/53502_1 /TAXON_ID=2866 ORGANISM="Crypthecodinium cohnii, Strain Seligo" /NCGR_SAMPLE_ID=MMETSP0323_2 /ASSEMBLY_ACC=CAM_ASM_000346 /LENGTH=66 /DNA_ID=CAMNT_0039707761 /DNA_START=139 /DNA_END=336 /DNA_ORIENTATION=-